MDAAFVAAIASCGTFALGVFTYIQLRRQHRRVTWTVERLPVTAYTIGGVRITNAGWSRARGVVLAFDPEPAHARTHAPRDVGSGASISVSISAHGYVPETFTIEWRAGIRKKWWTSALPEQDPISRGKSLRQHVRVHGSCL